MTPEKWPRGTPEKDHHWRMTIEAVSSHLLTRGLTDKRRTAELVSGMLCVTARDLLLSEAPEEYPDTHQLKMC